MIKTLKAHNGSFAKLGNPQVQPVIDDTSYAVKMQSTKNASLTSQAPVLASQAATTFKTLKAGATVSSSDKPSLQQVADAMSDESFIIPGFQSKFNTILPSYAASLEPQRLVDSHKLDALALSPKRFEPYEQASGISHLRPEIVMMTSFLPLFNTEQLGQRSAFSRSAKDDELDPAMTDAGHFVEAQIGSRLLRQANKAKLIKSLKSRNQGLSQALASKRSEFATSLDGLRETMTFLFSLVRGLDRLRSSLDLRDDLHVVNVAEASRSFLANHTKVRQTVKAHPMTDQLQRYLPSDYSLSDALVRLGYPANVVRNVYTSTKIWLQLVSELRDVWASHSLEFIDVEPVRQKSDSSPVAVTQFETQRFGFRSTSLAFPSVESLSRTQPNQGAIVSAVGKVDAAYKSLYRDIHFKSDEARFAAVFNAVSKEFRFSVGLARPEVRRVLSEQYGYSVTTVSNEALFDAVVGQPGTSIDDIAASTGASLASAAQRLVNENVALLSFESKYLESDVGTLTPGSAYYVDSVFRTDGQGFDTSQLDEGASIFERYHLQLGTVVNGMNLLGYRDTDETDPANQAFASLLGSPSDLARFFVGNIVNDVDGSPLPIASNDNLSAVYGQAARDSYLKSLLFMYTLARISRPYDESKVTLALGESTFTFDESDNTALADELLVKIVDRLVDKFKGKPQVGEQQAFQSFVTAETLKSSIKVGTALTQFIEKTIKQILDEFKNGALVGGRTRFSDQPDTVIAMAVFDLFVSMVAKYGNQKIVAYVPEFFYGKFTISRSTTNHTNSTRDIVTRLERESALTQQLVFAVMNTLKKLSGSMKNFSNYLKSPPALSGLREISDVLNDPSLLQLLLSEQQIMMLASTVYDLHTRLSRSPVPDIDGDDDVDGSDEVRSLDDSVVGSTLRSALYGLLSSPKFASSRGYNKKILTVGIPLGFTKRLRQKIDINELKKASDVDVENDFVSIVVYKVDLQNSDIVYKPLRFTFEMSRFPVRDQRTFLPLDARPTVTDIVNAIPTRDLGRGLDGLEPSYGNTNGEASVRGLKTTFDDEVYSFLTEKQKTEIVSNHVVSHLLETYIRLLTGMSVAEYHYHIIDPPKPMDAGMLTLLADNQSRQLADNAISSNNPTAGGVLFSLTATSKKKTTPTQTNQQGTSIEQQSSVGNGKSNLSTLSHRNISQALHQFSVLSGMSQEITPLSDGSAVSRQLMIPKQFDRVFNVIIDPDEFEIDYDKTVKTLHGKQALEQLITNGDVVPALRDELVRRPLTQLLSTAVKPNVRQFIQSRTEVNHASFKMRDRDRNEGDMVFEKYFVTVETPGEEESE